MYYMANQRLPRRRVRGCISSLVVVALIGGGLIFILGRAHNGVSISVGVQPTVIIHDCNQAILVRVGKANQVVLSGVFPQYAQDTATDTIEMGGCDSEGGLGGVTLTVPPHTNLQLDANDSITIFDVSGQMNLSANGSRITMINVGLEGQSKIDDNGGVITFIGNLAQGSNSTVSGNSGAIDMTLPASAAFHLATSGILGQVISNVPEVQASTAVGDQLDLEIGHANSGVTLNLDLNDTALILRKGQ
jgi:hypothetical protein